MRILVMNTCGAEGIVGLVDPDGVLAHEQLPGRGTSEALMPAVRRMLADGFDGLGGIGVVNGPGSFTGVRVGLSAAKGLCDALGVGMIAMSRLALVAAAGEPGRVVAVLDAGRGEYFCGVSLDGRMVLEELLREPETRALFAGGDVLTCEARVAERLGIRLVPEPGAEAMRTMVFKRITANEWSDVATVDANYLRRTDAELLVNAP